MGGELNPISIPSPRGGARAAQEEPLAANGSSGGKGRSGGGVSGGTRDEALRPDAVPGIGHHDGGVASQHVGHPLSPPRIGLHDGAAHGDHGGVG